MILYAIKYKYDEQMQDFYIGTDIIDMMKRPFFDSRVIIVEIVLIRTNDPFLHEKKTCVNLNEF